MNTLEQLVKEARQRRDDVISQAHKHYLQTVEQLKLVNRENRVIVVRTAKRRKRYSASQAERKNFSKMTTLAAAEALLVELGPMNLAELVVELQRRGHRVKDDPRVVGHAARTGMLYHEGRFSRDGEGRWKILSQSF